MRRNLLKTIITLSFVGALALSTIGCGNSKANTTTSSDETTTTVAVTENSTNSTDNNEVQAKVVKAARVFGSPPYNYIDENGNQTGFETEVIKAVFDLLPQYELEIVDTTDEELLIGIQEGKYDFGFKSAWWTEQRAANYAIPNEFDAVTTVGLVIRKEDAEKIKSLKDFALSGGRLVPIAPSNGQYAVVEDFNKENPDSPIKLEAAEQFTVSEAYTWVLEGRYDAYMTIRHGYQNNIVKEDGPYHQFDKDLTFVIYESIPTYPLFSKNNQEIADAFEGAIKILKGNGFIDDLQIKYFGENIYQYIKQK